MELSPVLVDVPARRVVGVVVISPMEPNLCPTAWHAFEPRIREVAIEGDCLGVCWWDYPGLTEGHFAYMACFESSMVPPEGMEAWELPAARYASVEISGLEAIRPTIAEFYDAWLPQSGLSAGSAPFTELYPETFPESPKLNLLFSVEPS
jgi:predicted transcriptional regulator YdeE